jgi:hypothetical protein
MIPVLRFSSGWRLKHGTQIYAMWNFAGHSLFQETLQVPLLWLVSFGSGFPEASSKQRKASVEKWYTYRLV